MDKTQNSELQNQQPQQPENQEWRELQQIKLLNLCRKNLNQGTQTNHG